MPKKSKYTHLLHGCYRTEISVTPSNWHTQKASVRKPWVIWYRYYDPQNPEYKEPFRIKGMNDCHNLEDRQKRTRALIATEEELLDRRHYNPITKKYMQPPAQSIDEPDDRPVTPKTGLADCLDWAFKNIERAPDTLKEIGYIWAAAKTAAQDIGLDTKPMGTVEKADIRRILDRIGRNKLNDGSTWTAAAFNRYKAHLGMLFFFLEDYSVFKDNPSKGIKKKKRTRKDREILSDEDYKRMDRAVKAFDHYFWRLIRIFQESGCRRPEMLGVKFEDVDLKKRRFKVLIKKDNEYREDWKDIDSKVLHLWKEVMSEADQLKAAGGEPGENLYLFCEGLRPQWREKPISPRQITRRWRLHIKEKLGITADLYSLRHRRTTRDIDRAVEKAVKEARKKAARKNSHTTTKMVEKVYDVNRGRKSAIIRALYRKKKVVIRFRPVKSA